MLPLKKKKKKKPFKRNKGKIKLSLIFAEYSWGVLYVPLTGNYFWIETILFSLQKTYVVKMKHELNEKIVF